LKSPSGGVTGPSAASSAMSNEISDDIASDSMLKRRVSVSEVVFVEPSSEVLPSTLYPAFCLPLSLSHKHTNV